MGGASSGMAFSHEQPDVDFREFLDSQRETYELMLNQKLSLETQIEHYYPPSFPIEPIVNHHTVEVCRESWDRIKKLERDGRSGMVYFFDVFYLRLFDRSSLFEEFFQGDMKKKGKILIRIMEFFCAIDPDNLRAFYSTMIGLARVHNSRNIRPWMYSVFVETMVNSISYVLDDEATLEVSTAWTNIAALAMRGLLPGSVLGQIKTEEANLVYHDPKTAQATHHQKRRKPSAATAAGGMTGTLSSTTRESETGAEERKTGGAVGGDYLGGAAAKQPALSVDLGKDDTSRRGSEATAASPINSAGPHTTGLVAVKRNG